MACKKSSIRVARHGYNPSKNLRDVRIVGFRCYHFDQLAAMHGLSGATLAAHLGSELHAQDATTPYRASKGAHSMPGRECG